VTLDLPAGKYALDASIFGENNDSDTQPYTCTLHSPATIFASGGNGGGFVSINDGFAPSPASDMIFLTGVTTLAAPGQIFVDCNAFDAFFTVKLTALTIQ
jgi:hypothetical protein